MLYRLKYFISTHPLCAITVLCKCICVQLLHIWIYVASQSVLSRLQQQMLMISIWEISQNEVIFFKLQSLQWLICNVKISMTLHTKDTNRYSISCSIINCKNNYIHHKISYIQCYVVLHKHLNFFITRYIYTCTWIV